MHRTARRTLAAAACSAALALAVTGCGSDDKDDAKSGTTGGDTLSVEEFKTQANAICKAQDDAEAKAFAAAQDAITSGDEAAATAAIKEGVAVIRGEADAIAALAAPEELKADVDALVSALNDGLDNLEQDGPSAIGGLQDPSQKATALGLTECGN